MSVKLHRSNIKLRSAGHSGLRPLQAVYLETRSPLKCDLNNLLS